MSTILKALRRLEEEKTAPVGRRPLREEVTHRGDSPRSRRGAWLLGLAGLVGGVAAGMALIALWPRDIAVEPPGQPLVRAPARPPQAARAAPEVARQELPAEALASPVEVVARPKPKPLVVDEPSPAAAAERGDAAASLSGPPVASPPPPAAIAPAQDAPPARPSLGSREASYAELEEIGARLAEVPAPVSAGIHVEQTLWHPRPERRVAVLALDGDEGSLRVQEGDTVRGLVVSEIEPSGVVFEHEGRRVRRGLGEAP